jgi:chemotaxis signal transduction protein
MDSEMAQPMELDTARLADSVTMEGAQAQARLSEYAQGRFIGLPPHTVYALIEHPAFVVVPGAASYAWGLLAWQDMRIPLIDLNVLLHSGTETGLCSAPRYALIVAYQRVARGPVEYGAIGLVELPKSITVSDDAQCELPTDSVRWKQLALSCFRHEGYPVPILNTARLFGDLPL